MTDQEKEPALSQDQTSLLASVVATDATLAPPALEGQGGAAVGGVPAVVEDPVEENAAMLQTLLDVLAPALPFLPEIYTPKIVKQIAIAFTKVEQKHGWNIAGKLPPEAALAMVAIPPTVQAFIIGKIYIENMKGQAQAAAQGGTDGNS